MVEILVRTYQKMRKHIPYILLTRVAIFAVRSETFHITLVCLHYVMFII